MNVGGGKEGIIQGVYGTIKPFSFEVQIETYLIVLMGNEIEKAN